MAQRLAGFRGGGVRSWREILQVGVGARLRSSGVRTQFAREFPRLFRELVFFPCVWTRIYIFLGTRLYLFALEDYSNTMVLIKISVVWELPLGRFTRDASGAAGHAGVGLGKWRWLRWSQGILSAFWGSREGVQNQRGCGKCAWGSLEGHWSSGRCANFPVSHPS